MSKRPELMITNGELAGRRFAVADGGTRLGRSSTNDIHIQDDELSRNHSLFEVSGEDGIRITDLASANGTYVNGEALGADPRALRVGDRIEVGSVVIEVVGEPPSARPAVPTVAAGAVPATTGDAGSPVPAGGVDLGLGEPQPTGGADAGAKRRSPIANILWAVTALVVIAAIGLVLFAPRSRDPAPVVIAEKEAPMTIDSLYYEKVEADAGRIFRYEMKIEDDVLSVAFDDVPEEDRHVSKKAKLSDHGRERIREIFGTAGFFDLDNTYAGSSAADENELKSWRIRVIRNGSVKDILVENTYEPDIFASVREALEAFSRNELGIWAIQYTREKLIELSAASAEVGDAKWDEREADYGNLSAAVKAYREAIFYLDTVNPKPDGYPDLKGRLKRTEDELANRYKEQRFLADKAINTKDWETARSELKILCEMVPDRDDDRHDEANAKLVDVENRMKKAKGGR